VIQVIQVGVGWGGKLWTSEITYSYNNYGVSVMQGVTNICHLHIQKAWSLWPRKWNHCDTKQFPGKCGQKLIQLHT